VFFIGGTLSFERGSRQLLSYNPVTSDITEKPQMQVGRYGFGACRIRERLLVLGGVADAVEVLSSCEEYNIAKEEWREFPPLA